MKRKKQMEEELSVARARIEKEFALKEERQEVIVRGQALFDRWQARLDALPLGEPTYVVMLRAHGQEVSKNTRKWFPNQPVHAVDEKGKLNFELYVESKSCSGMQEVSRGPNIAAMLPSTEDGHALHMLGVVIETKPSVASWRDRTEIQNLPIAPLFQNRPSAEHAMRLLDDGWSNSVRRSFDDKKKWFSDAPDYTHPVGAFSPDEWMFRVGVTVVEAREYCRRAEEWYARIGSTIDAYLEQK